MTPADYLPFIRARLDDWTAVHAACQPDVAPLPADTLNPADTLIRVSDQAGRVLWTTDDVGSTASALRIIVDMCEPALARPVGHPDRAWADTLLGAIVLIWAEHPDYLKLVHA